METRYKTVFQENLDIVPRTLERLTASASFDQDGIKRLCKVEHHPPSKNNSNRGYFELKTHDDESLGYVYYEENKQSTTVSIKYCDWENDGLGAEIWALCSGYKPRPEKAEIFEQLAEKLRSYNQQQKPTAPDQTEPDFGKRPNVKARRKKIFDLREDIMLDRLTDHHLAEQFGVSVDTIQKDRKALGITFRE